MWNLKILVPLLLLMSCASQTRADIFEWAYVDPGDPTQGVYQSSVVCLGGSGVSAVPGAYLINLDLTQAYLIGANLTNADLANANLTNALLTGATVVGVNFIGGRGVTYLTPSQLYSTASYKAQDLRGISLGRDLTGWNFSGQNLTNASFYFANLANANLTNANLTSAQFSSDTLTNANLTGGHRGWGQLPLL